jgi:hypothetical protein
MNAASSKRARTGSWRILGAALVLGLGIAAMQGSASAGPGGESGFKPAGAADAGLVTQIGHGNKWRGGKNVYVNKNFVVVRPVRGWKYRNYYDQASLSERSWA